MISYTGTKELLARPMTRGEYNAYRGWGLAEDEDGTEDGYLVEYTEGGGGNHGSHKGYISWSPADVFENTYKPNGSYVDRLSIERDGLSTRLSKLMAFIKSEKFTDVPAEEQNILKAQAVAMTDYATLLGARYIMAKLTST